MRVRSASGSVADVYIVDGARTPIGKFGKSLRNLSAVELAAITIKALVEKTGIPKDRIQALLMGHVIRAGTGMNTAKQSALKAGLGEDVIASNVDMVCASGMRAVIDASIYVSQGYYDLVVAGGAESMSNSPFFLGSRVRWGVKLVYRGSLDVFDSMVYDGLRDPIYGLVMGDEADYTAKLHGVTREELDWVGYESHRRAGEAWDKGFFKEHVVPVDLGDGRTLEVDEGIIWDPDMEYFKSLKPAFSSDGLHTKGTSSQLSDGAAFLVLASRSAVEELGLKPKARIVGWSFSSLDPRRFPEAPIFAIEHLLKRLGWSVNSVDYWENNEAFAVNSVLMNRMLGVSYDVLNVNGGAIALGHPLGMSGARILLELVYTLNRRGGRRGIASICHGLGGAAAVAVETL